MDGQTAQTVVVGFQAEASGPAYVAKEALPVGRVFDPRTLPVKEVAWTGRDPLPLPVRDAHAGASDPQVLRLVRPLAAGEILNQGQVEAAPLVAQGDQALLRSVAGAVQVECPVEVLQDGSLGQQVRVRMPKAAAPILARVAGSGLVEVAP